MLDPAISTVSRWADEDPAAMRRLLADAELRAHLARALDELAPDEGVEGDAAAAG